MLTRNFYSFCTLFLSMIVCFALHSQPALISRHTPYNYFPAQQEPPAEWYLPGFNDSGWAVDTQSIGFGNEAQVVEISPATKSLYLRYRFEVNTPQNVKRLSFLGDYDDGFVAYLNGKEILRKNIDPSVRFPSYDHLAFRSHEKEYRTPYPVYGYYLDSLLLDTCLVEGENVLSVHVLNDSVYGSDLFFNLQLFDVTTYDYNTYNIAFRAYKKVEPDSMNFPLVKIETDEFGIPYKNRRVKAHMGIIDQGPGYYNKPSDSCNIYYGNVSIEVRGQSSSEFPKRSYRFELWDEFDTDTNVSLLGLPANDDWILFGPFQDKAHFRNPMIFDMARRFGRYQPRTKYCELMLNGDYMGLYVLVETVKRSPDRLNIARLRPEEVSGNDVTGGYILKYDKPMGNMQIVYPRSEEIVQEQINYIETFMDEYESILFTNDFMDPAAGFRKYINDTSLVDHIIMTEFPRNCDGYMYSTYFYKDRADRDNRITYGPVWDNDLVFGNTQFQNGHLPEGWHFEFNWGRTNIHIMRMLQDRNFVELLQDRWQMARESFLHTDSIMTYIDTAVVYLADPIERNYAVWPVIDQDLFHSNYVSTSYVNEIYNIKSWIAARLQWIDDNIDQIYYDVDFYSSYEPLTEESYFGFEVYPVPFTDQLNLACSSSEQALIRVEIYDVSGKMYFSDDYFVTEGYSVISMDDSRIEALGSGFYLIRVLMDGEQVSVRKIMKN